MKLVQVKLRPGALHSRSQTSLIKPLGLQQEVVDIGEIDRFYPFQDEYQLKTIDGSEAVLIGIPPVGYETCKAATQHTPSSASFEPLTL